MSSAHLTENDILAFLAGALDPTAIARLEAHIDGCIACRGWLSASARKTEPDGHQALRLYSFEVGQVVAGRYRIVRFIAEGGMGELYEVHDTVLGVLVALKTVRQAQTDEPLALERLRRELKLARQVTHPNVSRVYDVGLHPGATPISFFTLELLSGETLKALLDRVGRLPVDQARPILSQVAAGLDAVHAVGVLHRDLKSDNIFLRKTAEGPQAVLTDFGLARPTQAGGSLGTLPGSAVGTPAYMAPEQVSGDNVGPAADLYSLGVVAFEMVTGALPFQGATAMATASLRLTTLAPDPGTLVADLPVEWSRCIARLLQRSPNKRPATGAEAVALLAPPRPRWSNRRRLAGGLVLLALALGVATARVRKAVTSSAEHRRALAVLPLQTNSPNDSGARWLAVALGQVLAAGLTTTASSNLRQLSPERAAQLSGDLALAPSGELTATQLAAARDALDPDLVLTGALSVSGQGDDRPFRLDVRLYDVGLGTKIAQVSEQGTELDFVACATRAIERLRAPAARADPRARGNAERDEGATRAQVPQSVRAAQAWAEGTRALAAFELAEAKVRLEETVALEPTFAPAHAALAQTLLSFGLRDEAVLAAQRAFAHAGSLPREQRLTIEALFRSSQRDWSQAIALYRTLWVTFPDDLEHGLQLANAQTLASAPKDALATVDQLRQALGPNRQDPRIELAAAQALMRVPDFEAAQQAAARAGAQADRLGQRWLAARAKLAEAEALVFLSRRDEALILLKRAADLFDVVGDRAGVAKVKVARGHVLRDRGELDLALAQYAEAEALDRALGDELNLATVLGAQAVIARRKGNAREALRLNEQVLALFEKHGSKTNICTTLNNLGRVFQDLGQPEAAEARYEQAIALATELGENSIRARALGSLGLLAADRGDLARGRKAFEDILEIIRLTGETALQAGALEVLVGLLVLQGDLGAASARVLEHETLSQGAKLENELARATLRAEVAFAKRDLSQAETLAREVAEGLKERHAADDELAARTLLVGVLIASRNGRAVDHELLRLHELAGGDESSRPALAWAQLRARAHAELGNAQLGVTQLTELLKRPHLAAATKHAMTLSLVRAYLRLGQRPVAAARLTELTSEATREGFGLVVADANALRDQLRAANR
jgi:eukaryotic-like serine/threonine-protein kinase